MGKIRTSTLCLSFLFLIFNFIFSNTLYAIHGPSTVAKIIFHTQNDQGNIWVFETSDARYLSFLHPASLDATQSKILLNAPEVLAYEYTKIVLGGLYVHPMPEKVLIIGLGGGSIPKALLELFPQLKLDIVEINADLPLIAEVYFYFKPTSNTRLFIMDALDFFKEHHDKYDMIILDAFGENDIPAPLRTVEFTQTLKNSLDQNGIFIVNTYSHSKYYNLDSLPYKKIFGDLITITKQNQIIIAKNGVLPSMEQIQNNANHLDSRISKFGIDKNWLLEKFKKV